MSTVIQRMLKDFLTVIYFMSNWMLVHASQSFGSEIIPVSLPNVHEKNVRLYTTKGSSMKCESKTQN